MSALFFKLNCSNRPHGIAIAELPVRKSLFYRRLSNFGAIVEVRDGAGDLEYAVPGSGGEAEG